MPRSLTLSLELLQTIVSLIRHDGEASATMAELGLNQPTLSKRLKYLQHAGPLLEQPWLVRDGKIVEALGYTKTPGDAAVPLSDSGH